MIIRDFMAGKSCVIIVVDKLCLMIRVVVDTFRAIIHNSVLQVSHDDTCSSRQVLRDDTFSVLQVPRDACSDKHIPDDPLILRTAKHAALRNTRTTFSARQLELLAVLGTRPMVDRSQTRCC